jgi:putative membrane protein
LISVAHAHTAAESPAVPGGGEWPLLALLAVAGVWYAIGFAQIWRASGTGRAHHARRGVLFAVGLAAIAVTLLSPLHGLGVRSFAAHMVEHEVLMLVAAPLLAFSRPLGALVWAFPRRARFAVGRISRRRWYAAAWARISAPLAATVIQAAMLWLWHAPALFDRALRQEGWHVAQHAGLLLSATLFWWAIDRTSEREGRHGVAGFLLFFSALQSGLLGALMAFSGSPWYAQYVALGLAGVITDPLRDQQLAGFIMWIPGGAVHAAAALFYLGRWFREEARA